MAFTACITNQAKQDFLNGVHAAADTYKLALYTSGTYDKTTTAYSATGECSNSGTGYTTGGITLTGQNVTMNGDTAVLDFDDAVIATATLANVIGAILYNSSKSNKAIAVISFAATSSTNAEFRVAIPSGVVTFGS